MILAAVIAFVVVILVLCIPLSQAERKENVKQSGRTVRDDAEDELSFGDKLILGAGAAHLMEAEERRYQERKAEREKKRRDELFWQDAAREDEEEEDY